MRRRKSYSARAGAFLRTHPNRSSLIFLRLTLTALTFTLAGCDSFGEKYAAEVGYRAGGEIKWEIWGDYASLDECRNAAIPRYNHYWADNRRATSWACLKKNRSGGYESR